MTNNAPPNQEILVEAIKVFDAVNSKVNGLIDCSVKDFEILNNSFKKHYNYLQILSHSSNNFISYVIELSSVSNTKSISNTYKSNLSSTISNYIEKLKIQSKNLNYLILLVSNLKQDLSTLKLLFTNLRFDPTYNSDYKDINKTLCNIGDILEDSEKNIQTLVTIINKTIKYAEEGLFNGIDIFMEQLEKTIYSLQYISNLKEKTIRYKAELETLDVQRTNNTSEIITNLQFQDILRQKIEHVQNAHKSIIENLRTTYKENKTIKNEELYKIRDVNTLQSAQLIHANQEYQKAVETIMHKINELNSVLNKYFSIWNHFCKPEDAKTQALRSKLAEQIPLLNSHSFSIDHLYDKFSGLLEQLEKELKSFSEKKPNDKEILPLKEIIDTLDSQSKEAPEFNPVSQLINEFNKFEKTYNKYLSSLKEFQNDLEQNKILPRIDLSLEIISIKKIAAELKETSQDVLNSEYTNKDYKKEIESLANFSIEEVSYYKKFEKEVQEIINLLDNLLVHINVNRNEIDKERLEYLKNLYTVESEREIHDLVTGNKNQDKDKNKNNDEEDDNIEFF